MASRMQSTGYPMSVQVSEEVYQHAARDNLFCPLGERQIKGKGLCPTYLLKVRLQSRWSAKLCRAL